MDPLVTIITATYNQAVYLEQCIESVLSQDYPCIEYIVLDDGSTDQTKQVLNRYSGQIICESHENMGEGNTVNKGFKMAKGQIIGTLSSDDYYYQGAISEQVDRLLSNPNLVVVYPDFDLVDANGIIVDNIQNYSYNYINMVRWQACMPGPAALYRRELPEKLNGRDGTFRYVGDFDFWLRAGLLGDFERCPKTFASFRRYEGSQTYQRGYSMAKEHIRLVHKFYALPNLPENIQQVKMEAFSSAYYLAGVVCHVDKTYWHKMYYYLRAYLYCPAKYNNEYSYRKKVILDALKFPFKRDPP